MTPITKDQIHTITEVLFEFTDDYTSETNSSPSYISDFYLIYKFPVLLDQKNVLSTLKDALEKVKNYFDSMDCSFFISVVIRNELIVIEIKKESEETRTPFFNIKAVFNNIPNSQEFRGELDDMVEVDNFNHERFIYLGSDRITREDINRVFGSIN
ncbi:MAG: hypothetical protein H3C31_11825 [Brumimicrobium sp.]|nr:hypothetical protein [Brumimicrobium sp.]